MTMLKLAALDAEDLDILSAHLQDALIRVGDMRYLPREQRFAFIANRFNWLSAETDAPAGAARPREEYERRRAGVHFERVRAVRAAHLRQDAKDAVLELLAVRFEPGEAPGGAIVLVFAGGGAIRLEVECVESVLKDLGPAWTTGTCPSHPLEEARAEASGPEPEPEDRR